MAHQAKRAAAHPIASQTSLSTLRCRRLHPRLSSQVSLQFPDLVKEAALLDRLLYKNRNQHRGSLHFRKLSEVGE